MSARNKILDVFDVSGGIAGASMILAGILLLVSLPTSTQKLVQIIIAAFLLAVGFFLSVRRRLRRTRVVIGAIFLILFVLSLIAAILLPNLHRFG